MDTHCEKFKLMRESIISIKINQKLECMSFKNKKIPNFIFFMNQKNYDFNCALDDVKIFKEKIYYEWSKILKKTSNFKLQFCLIFSMNENNHTLNIYDNIYNIFDIYGDETKIFKTINNKIEEFNSHLPPLYTIDVSFFIPCFYIKYYNSIGLRPRLFDMTNLMNEQNGENEDYDGYEIFEMNEENIAYGEYETEDEILERLAARLETQERANRKTNDMETFYSETCVLCLDENAKPTVLFCSCGHIPICEKCNVEYDREDCPACRVKSKIKRKI